MCLAIPARITSLIGSDQAMAEIGGVGKQISIELVPDAQVGDYVIVHVGHAIGRLDAHEAERTLARFDEAGPQTAMSAT